MHATIRRYESIDQSRKSEVLKKVDENLLPSLSELPGFNGYSLIDAGNGVMTSVGFFDTAAQADESTRIAGSWLREQKLETALPNRAEDHQPATSSSHKIARARPGLTASSSSQATRRPAHAGLLRVTGQRSSQPPSRARNCSSACSPGSGSLRRRRAGSGRARCRVSAGAVHARRAAARRRPARPGSRQNALDVAGAQVAREADAAARRRLPRTKSLAETAEERRRRSEVGGDDRAVARADRAGRCAARSRPATRSGPRCRSSV